MLRGPRNNWINWWWWWWLWWWCIMLSRWRQCEGMLSASRWFNVVSKRLPTTGICILTAVDRACCKSARHWSTAAPCEDPPGNTSIVFLQVQVNLRDSAPWFVDTWMYCRLVILRWLLSCAIANSLLSSAVNLPSTGELLLPVYDRRCASVTDNCASSVSSSSCRASLGLRVVDDTLLLLLLLRAFI